MEAEVVSRLCMLLSIYVTVFVFCIGMVIENINDGTIKSKAQFFRLTLEAIFWPITLILSIVYGIGLILKWILGGIFNSVKKTTKNVMALPNTEKVEVKYKSNKNTGDIQLAEADCSGHLQKVDMGV